MPWRRHKRRSANRCLSTRPSSTSCSTTPASTCSSPPPSTTCSTCSAATASSSSTAWMPSASAATCRSLVYRKGKPEEAAYVGYAMENLREGARQVLAGAPLSRRHGRARRRCSRPWRTSRSSGGVRRVGIEAAFLPADAEDALRRGLVERRYRRCGVPARAAARAQDAARARVSARGLRTRGRIHAGDPQAVQARHRPSTRSPRRCGARRSTAASSSTIA